MEKLSAVIGALMGLVPHVLHHIGLIAGAALVTGALGNLLFGVLGLLLSIPLLRQLHRRCNTWKRRPGLRRLSARAVQVSTATPLPASQEVRGGVAVFLGRKSTNDAAWSVGHCSGSPRVVRSGHAMRRNLFGPVQ